MPNPYALQNKLREVERELAAYRKGGRDAIRAAIDAALTAGDLSEEWAMSIYANLDEPPSMDDEGWAIFYRTDPSTTDPEGKPS